MGVIEGVSVGVISGVGVAVTVGLSVGVNGDVVNGGSPKLSVEVGTISLPGEQEAARSMHKSEARFFSLFFIIAIGL